VNCLREWRGDTRWAIVAANRQTDRLTTMPWELLGEAESTRFADELEPPCKLLLRRVDFTAGRTTSRPHASADGGSVPAEAEGVAGGIEVHPKFPSSSCSPDWGLAGGTVANRGVGLLGVTRGGAGRSFTTDVAVVEDPTIRSLECVWSGFATGWFAGRYSPLPCLTAARCVSPPGSRLACRRGSSRRLLAG
jgi:hypothetical protein